MNHFSLFLEFLGFWFKAHDAHGLHSPFVYELYTEVIAPRKMYYALMDIANLRNQLLQNQELISVTDYGAGSSTTTPRTVRQIAKKSAISPQKGALLFRLVDFFNPKTIIELGTSLGLGTLYLSEASAKAQLYTFEGCPQLCRLARQHTANAYANIRIVEGNIDQTLVPHLQQINKVDFVFFDANHRAEPTWRYFEQCLAYSHEGTVMVFDDIRWSAEMKKVWKQIIQDQRVWLSFDLFSMGIILFRQHQPKQHFLLRF